MSKLWETYFEKAFWHCDNLNKYYTPRHCFIMYDSELTILCLLIILLLGGI